MKHPVKSKEMKPKSGEAGEIEEVAGVDWKELPEGYIANILAFTNPVDACRLVLFLKLYDQLPILMLSGRNSCLLIVKFSHLYHSLQRKSFL